ncbi:MAG: gliding motility-associated C-terminal domain-containing protein, partial [Bacteroidales bacterium]|nr:gliding motility-associated C-terminal domain-containing protein [Bacteroidales bacterium]
VDLGTDQTLCSYDVPITLDAGAAMSDYNWSDGSDTQTSDVSTSDTYAVTVTDGNGCTANSSMTLTANTAPSVDLGTDQSLCSYDVPITLDAGAAMSDYNWSDGSDTQTLDVSTSDTYAVTVTDGNGCTANSSMALTVNTTPIVDLGGDQVICDYDNLMLDAGAGMSDYAWSTGDDTQTLTVDAEDDYFVTVTASNGCTATDAMHLSLETSPVPDLGSDTVVCSYDAPVTLNPGTSAVYNYSWSEGSSSPTIDVVSSGTYEVTVSAGSCSATDQVDVTVNPAPTVDLGTDQTLCAYDVPITLDAGASMSDYNWSEGSDTQTLAASASDTYAVTVTDGNACTASSSMVLTVNPTPTVDLGSDQALCSYDAPLSIDAGAAFDVYNWSTGENSQAINVSGSDSYTVTVTNLEGCTATSTVIVDVNLAPSLDLGADISLCDSELPFAINAGVGMSDYIWSTGNTQENQEVNASGNYAVTITDNNSCTASDMINVDVQVSVEPTFTIIDNYCEGEQADQLNSTSENDVNGVWSPSEINTNLVGQADYVFIPSSGECANNVSITVTVDEMLTPEFQNFGPYCVGESVDLLPTESNNGITGSWTPFVITSEIAGSQNYQFTPADEDACIENYSQSVVINPYPEFDVWISDSVIYSDNTVSIEVTGVDQLIWTPSDMLSCNDCLNPVFYADENQASNETYSFMLTADENGCQTTDSVFITVLADVPIHIPSGFSPNNDNIGDTWIIDGLIPFPDNEITVFNRWGNMVYQAKPYNNTWDGRNMNGGQLPAGTYYYVLKLHDKNEETFSGYIYIAY